MYIMQHTATSHISKYVDTKYNKFKLDKHLTDKDINFRLNRFKILTLYHLIINHRVQNNIPGKKMNKATTECNTQFWK